MNTIYIQSSSGEIIESPILDDIQIEAQSEFSTVGELLPTLDFVATALTALETTGKTTASKTAVKARSILDLPRWTKTNPAKINLELYFYTKDCAYDDVYLPLTKLISLHVLSRTSKGTLRIPGFSAQNITKITEQVLAGTAKSSSVNIGNIIGDFSEVEDFIDNQTDSLISVLIPNVIYLPYAYIHAIQPTYSKHLTNKYNPLWASASIVISSLFPAMSENFTDGINTYYANGVFVNMKTKKVV